MNSDLADELLQIHEYADYSDTCPAAGLLALRLASGLSRDDVYDECGIPPIMLELHEEHGGWPDMGVLIALAECYECTPGELVDAVACLEEAQQHDIAAERKTRQQADKLLWLLERTYEIASHTWITNAWMEQNGVATNNAPLNDLLDRGYPVEIVRDSTGKNLGVRLRREE